MNEFAEFSEDSPLEKIMQGDREFYQQLEASIAKQFYDRCHAEIQELLSCCQWHITTENHVLTLIILCPTTHINWQVLQQVVPLGEMLAPFSDKAKLCICSPKAGDPFEIRVNELSVYRDRSQEKHQDS